MRKHAVEHFSPGFVLVEALVHEVTQVAAALRNSGGNHFFDTLGRGPLEGVVAHLVPEEAYEVARRGKADAEYFGILGGVGEFVERAGLRLGADRQQRDLARIDERPVAYRNL